MSPCRRAQTILALALAALGCANQVILNEAGRDSGQRRASVPSALVIDWLETRRAGFENNPSSELIASLTRFLAESKTFSAVYEPRRAHTAPEGSFRLRVRVDERFDRHPVRTGTKLVATIVTGALPGVFVPFYYDDLIVVDGELLTPHGSRHRYRVERSGSVRSFLLIGLATAEHDLRARVWNEALRSFASSVTSDTTFTAGGR